MLRVPLKSTRHQDLEKPLNNYLKKKNKENASQYEDAVRTLQNYRDAMMSASGSSEEARLAVARYYVQIDNAAARFPVNESNIRVAFAWTECFDSRKTITVSNIKYEKASTLFNLGALLSQAGSLHPREDAEGTKMACHLYQQAAGTFQKLRRGPASEVLGKKPPDLGSDALEMFEFAMLAQAQSLMFEKAIKDKLSPKVLARLAQQVSAFYHRAHSLCVSTRLPVPQEWTDRLLFQSKVFEGSANYWQSKSQRAEAEKKHSGFGAEVALLRHAQGQAQTALEVGRKGTVLSSLIGVAEGLLQAVSDRLAEAEHDVKKIYMEVVPERSALPAISPAPLVQAKEPSDVLEAAGPDLFEGLVSPQVAEVARRFKEELADAGRTSRAQLNSQNAALHEKLAGWGLPAAVQGGEGASSIPDAMWREIEQTQRRGGLDALMSRMESNQAVRRRVEDLLRQCRSALAAEAEQDDHARRELGPRLQRPPSAELAASMEQELKRYEELMAASGTGDEAVGRKVEEHWEAMCQLAKSREELAAEIPGADSSAGSVAPEKQRLQSLLEQLDSDVAARTRAQDELERVGEDQSIEVELMRRGLEVKEALFDELRQKHATLLSQVSESLEAQDRRLGEIETAYRQWRSASESSPEARKRDEALSRLQLALAKFKEVEANVEEGTKFYNDLETHVLQTQQTIADFRYTRNMELKEQHEALSRDSQSEQDAAYAARLAAEGDGQQQGAAAAAPPPPPPPPAASSAPHPSAYPAQPPRPPPPYPGK